MKAIIHGANNNEAVWGACRIAYANMQKEGHQHCVYVVNSANEQVRIYAERNKESISLTIQQKEEHQ